MRFPKTIAGEVCKFSDSVCCFEIDELRNYFLETLMGRSVFYNEILGLGKKTYYFNKRQISGTIREYREDGPQNLKRHVIKIRDGIYTGKQLEKYLNINVFSAPAPGSRVRRYRRINENIDESKLQNDKVEQTRGVFNTDVEAAFTDALAAGTDPEVENNPSLDMQQQLQANNAALLAQLEAINLGTEFDEGEIFFNKVNDTQQVLKRIKCKYDEISRKFIFFRDRNDDVKGLKDTTDKAYKFNI